MAVANPEALLAEASRRLAGSLELDRTLGTLVDLVVPDLGDWCVVDLFRDGGEVERAAVRHRDPARAAAAEALLGMKRGAPDLAGNGPALKLALAGAQPETLAAKDDPRRVALLEELGVGAYLTVLLRARDRALGALTVVNAPDTRPFATEDLLFIQELADRAGLALDHARTLTEIRAQRDRLERALEHAGTGAWGYDGRSGFVSWSRRTGSLHGLAHVSGEAPLRELIRHVPSEDAARLAEALEGAALTGGSVAVEYRVVVDGGLRWLLARGGPEGTDGRLSGTLTDVTPIKQSEEELQRALRQRDEFLSIASHELNTPLTALQLNLQMLSRRVDRAQGAGELPLAKVKSSVRTMVDQVERLGRLLGNLLDVSRIRNDRLHLDLEAVDLTAIAYEMAERFRTFPQWNAVEIVTLPAKPVVGTWDRVRLEQVVANLLSNALKYGRGRPVKIGVEVAGEAAVVTVADEGIGIAEGDLSRVFDRFQRATLEHRTASLGLGLFVSREIVRAHGGRIDVTSVPGQGTTFFVVLPLRRDDARG